MWVILFAFCMPLEVENIKAKSESQSPRRKRESTEGGRDHTPGAEAPNQFASERAKPEGLAYLEDRPPAVGGQQVSKSVSQQVSGSGQRVSEGGVM